MTWRALPPLITDVARQLPDFPELRIVAGRIGDHLHELWPEERDAIARARDKRAREFATGRYLARCAMADLGVTAASIRRAEDRSPVWPEALLGSLTHAGDVAIAAVTQAGAVRGVGIDLEEADRVTEPLFGKLFTAAEREALALWERPPGRECLAAVMFSAKEAAYKAVYPQVGKFISFHEAEVDVDWPQRTLRVRYIGDHQPNRIMNHGRGHFCFFEGYVLTVFVIPR